MIFTSVVEIKIWPTVAIVSMLKITFSTAISVHIDRAVNKYLALKMNTVHEILCMLAMYVA